MFFAGSEPHDVAGMNLLDGATPSLREAGAACDDERLAERMRVPRSASAWFECDAGPGHARWLRCLK